MWKNAFYRCELWNVFNQHNTFKIMLPGSGRKHQHFVGIKALLKDFRLRLWKNKMNTTGRAKNEMGKREMGKNGMFFCK
jgi:hypothetical protein